MITKLVCRTAMFDGSGEIEYLPAGTPVDLIAHTSHVAEVKIPDGRTVEVAACAVEIPESEESLLFLAYEVGIDYLDLLNAAEEGRLLARKSFDVWLSTRSAVLAALALGKIKSPLEVK